MEYLPIIICIFITCLIIAFRKRILKFLNGNTPFSENKQKEDIYTENDRNLLTLVEHILEAVDKAEGK